MCGCGEVAALARDNDATKGHVRGEPKSYVHGHQRRGKKHTSEARKKMSVWGGTRGPGTAAWKGDKAKYAAVHMWLSRNYEKSGACDKCGTIGKTEWANVSGDYGNRERSNWREMCRSCHVREDFARPKRPVR